jgi:hypothetical protein
MPNVIESYLVSLGFQVEKGELRKFEDGIKAASRFVEKNTSGIIKQVAGWQTAIVGGFAAIATSVIGFGDHVADQDQKFRLFALRMFMTQESAKKLSIGLNALGASLEEVAWDPELHARFLTLIADQTKLQAQLGPDFAQNMRSIRDVRFELTRLQVAAQYLGMKLVSDIFKSFGFTIDDVLGKLREMSAWVQEHLPDISSGISSTLVPVLNDAWSVLKHVGVALQESAVAFINLTGALTGDSSIQDTVFKFENMSKAIQDLSGVFRDFADYFTDALQEMNHLVNALSFALTGKFSAAVGELKAFRDIESRGAPNTLDLFHMGTPNPAYQRGPGLLGAPSGPLASSVIAAARQAGIDPRYALGVATQESGIRETDANGRVITSKTGAQGVMQLMPGTARDLGVNPLDAQQNISGGVQYLAQMFAKYHDWKLALAAYNAGPGAVDKALRSPRGLASLPAETQDYISKVMGIASRSNVGQDIQESVNAATPPKPGLFSSDDFVRTMAAGARGSAAAAGGGEGASPDVAQNITVGPVNVTVAQTNANPHEIGNEVQHGITRFLRKQTQLDLAQLNPVY